jgi:hypothetical protein
MSDVVENCGTLSDRWMTLTVVANSLAPTIGNKLYTTSQRTKRQVWSLAVYFEYLVVSVEPKERTISSCGRLYELKHLYRFQQNETTMRESME